MHALRPVAKNTLVHCIEPAGAAVKRGELAIFTKGGYILDARYNFHESENLCARWCGPRRVTKAINDYVYKVEDLRNGSMSEVHTTRPKFYSDASLDCSIFSPYILQSASC